ncbi:alpha/beta fold hydrolase [Actinomadura soli]|uniref:alpha/beta fold hydrolase n=1 Tax=Actinomadura soli TaxID=2508997 RepID=UPI001485FCCA|nr:alpha/beta hydrolase [Actinomadura soli]
MTAESLSTAPASSLGEVRYIQTGSFRTAYYRGGQGSGRPIVLVHGGGAGADSRSNWYGCFELFTAAAETYAMDMVGFGLSEAPAPEGFDYTQDARNRQLIAFIEGLGLGPCVLVGNSMGGATSLGAAMLRPDLVAGLVLMGSGGLTTHISPELGPMVHYDFTVDGMRAIIDVLANPAFVPSEEQVRYRYELSIKPDVKAAYKATMGWVAKNGLQYPPEEIAKVRTRTLVVNGKQDLVVPIEQAFRFLPLLENSTGYLIPNCRHWAMIEYPEIFAREVLDFVADGED